MVPIDDVWTVIVAIFQSQVPVIAVVLKVLLVVLPLVAFFDVPTPSKS